MQTCHHNLTTAYIDCTHIDHDQLLQLLMFVSYVVDIIQKAPTSVPSILSALQLTMKRVRSKVTAAFDHGLLVAAKAGVAHRPYEPNYVCLARME